MTTNPTTHASPKAPMERDWDWSGTNKMDHLIHRGWDTVATAHAWFDPTKDRDHNPPQEKTAYKLPHHEIVDGELKVVWRGVVAAMTVVNGARSGLDVSESDRREVYEHLAAHYREFGEEPPEYNGSA